jgi:ABC-2 type transport system ATP-binding protein
MTILLSTHYMREAEQLCDEVVFLREGRILAGGDPAKLKRALLGDRIGSRSRVTWRGLADLPGILGCTVAGAGSG